MRVALCIAQSQVNSNIVVDPEDTIMADSSEHEEKRMILKRLRKRPKKNYTNIVSQWDYYDHDRKACQHLSDSYLGYKYNECLE